MQRRRVRKGFAGVKTKMAFKRIAAVLAACLLVRAISVSGAEEWMNSVFRRFGDADTVELILNTELGMTDLSLSPLSLISAELTGVKIPELLSSPGEADAPRNGENIAVPEGDEPDDTYTPSEGESDPSNYGEAAPAEPGARHETTITGEGSPTYISAEGIYIKNKTGYEIDIEGLLNSPLGIEAEAGEPLVLILHTHGSEAYTPEGEDMYVASDPSRTEDTRCNVVRVGDELTKALEEYGIGVVHDRELYDYPSYTGSYNRSLESIKAYLEEYPSIQIVIDLHRDALEGEDGTVYKTVAKLEGDACSQVMFVMGTNYSGLQHPDWQENLKLALKMQKSMNDMFPTLARPISLTQYRYNQHMTEGSMILEVGCNGNTLQEAITAVKHFAEAAAPVLLQLYG